MSVKYGKFKIPERIKWDEATQTALFTRFVIEPFERGFGHTIGNALRRVLLTSLEAPSILSVRIEGVPHEYMAIEGIVQDMTHIILNFKGALIRKQSGEEPSRMLHQVTKMLEITQEMIEEKGGSYPVTLRDLLGGGEYEIVNPSHLLFTVTKPMTKRIDLQIGRGRGYVPAERNPIEEPQVDEIVLDSAFSPVRLVNYFVENTRVGQDTDFDRLILEVTTDGRVHPMEALAYAAQIGTLHFQIFDQIKGHLIEFDRGEMATNRDREELLSKLALRIDEIELSVRSANCLESANVGTIGELVLMPESEMLQFRNFGKKSLTEIKKKLDDLGLSLNMDLSQYDVTRENIRDVLRTYKEEKLGGQVVE
ncbi:MAG: DNA-directed RNA polymerase subunit alpha [Verrucomicrobiota bacterium]|nr:DNA-directed RNA polymerase subunit alpha [Verrucomicrobiota bacterium]